MAVARRLTRAACSKSRAASRERAGSLSGTVRWWTATGHATVNGVTLEGLLDPCASIAGEVRPFLTTGAAGSTGALGQPWAAKVFGGAGALAVLVASLGSAQLELPIIETTPLWLSPTQVIATVGLT